MEQNYRIDAQLKKHIIRTNDAVSINYDGLITEKEYSFTLTTRKKYNNLYTFRHELYEFLKSIDYKYAINGKMEYHDQKGNKDKVHAHGVLYCGNPPKGNSTNTFRFKIEKLTTPTVWNNYIKKDIMKTLERHHDIQTGMFTYNQSPIILFDQVE